MLGCRLAIRLISYDWKNFARGAFKAIVDIDPLELQEPTCRPDLPVCADLADFLPRFLGAISAEDEQRHQPWLAQCKTWLRNIRSCCPNIGNRRR